MGLANLQGEDIHSNKAYKRWQEEMNYNGQSEMLRPQTPDEQYDRIRRLNQPSYATALQDQVSALQRKVDRLTDLVERLITQEASSAQPLERAALD